MSHCVWLLFIDLNGVFDWGKKYETFRLTWLELDVFSRSTVLPHIWNAIRWLMAPFFLPWKCHFPIFYEERKDWYLNAVRVGDLLWKQGNDHEIGNDDCIVKRFWCRRNIHSLNINLFKWIIYFHYTQVVPTASTEVVLFYCHFNWTKSVSTVFGSFPHKSYAHTQSTYRTLFMAIINSWWENENKN